MEITYTVKCSPVLNPTKAIVVRCGKCNAELARLAWETYHDYNRKRAEALKRVSVCPNCGTQFKCLGENAPKWEKADKKLGYGSLIAKCKNGDFLIFKYGSIYKWRYRKYGNLYADEMGNARTKELAKKLCQRHKEWKL